MLIPCYDFREFVYLFNGIKTEDVKQRKKEVI